MVTYHVSVLPPSLSLSELSPSYQGYLPYVRIIFLCQNYVPSLIVTPLMSGLHSLVGRAAVVIMELLVSNPFAVYLAK